MLTGSMVAIVTPFTPQGNIDYSLLGELIEFHIQEGTDAVVAVGTTGESTTLTHDEHIDVVRATVEFAAGRTKVVAGNGSNATAEAVFLTEQMAPLGVDGFLNVVPYYNKPSVKGLVEHYKAIAQVSDIPQLVYNVPSRTSYDAIPEVVAELAQIPHIVGIKEATGDVSRVKALRRLCGDDFILLSGDDGTSCEFLLEGGQGVISVTANLLPKLIKQMVDAAIQGQSELAKELDQKMRIMHETLFVESNPIPVKWAMARLGWISEVYRLPLCSPEPENKRIIEQAMLDVGLLK